MSLARLVTLVLVGLLLAAGCAPAQSGVSEGGQSPAPATPKRISMVLLGDPGYFSQAAYPGQGRIPGIGASSPLSTSGLTATDPNGAPTPVLGTGAPSTSDGSWRVFPDGSMETTSTLRPDVFWHDRTPVTANDLVFSINTYLDKASGMPRSTAALNSIAGVSATDARTVVVRWSIPYINADSIFGGGETPTSTLIYILPRHLLETPYSNQVNLLELSYWREDFIGTGPFQLKQYLPNSFAILDAFDHYVLGRPKIDQVELKFISDPNTVIANVLAGSLDLVMGGIVSFEQAADVAERWPEGHVALASGNSITIYAQFMDANPPLMTNPQFRRSLLMAMDRQTLLDSFQRGQASVAHTTVFSPTSAEFPYIEKSIVKYPFDPRRAAGMIEGLGYTRGPDGLFHDVGGPALSLEMRTIVREPQSKMVLAIADNWKQIGVDTQTYIIPDQQASDSQYRATFPAFQLLQQNTGFEQFHNANIPLPSNRYVGVNKGRISDAELTGGIDRYSVTIPWDERMQVAGQLIHRITDEVMYMPTMYRADSALIANRVKHVEGINYSWNPHEWSVE